MADTVTTQTISDTSGIKYVVKMTNLSDGTGETLVIELLWSGSVNSTIVFLSGNGHWDLRTSGNEIGNNSTTPTGDVLLSTKNFAAGDNYTILLEFR